MRSLMKVFYSIYLEMENCQLYRQQNELSLNYGDYFSKNLPFSFDLFINYMYSLSQIHNSSVL